MQLFDVTYGTSTFYVSKNKTLYVSRSKNNRCKEQH